MAGRIHRFHLESDAMKKAHDWIKEYETFWQTNLDQLDEFLKKQTKKEKKK